MNSSKIVSYSKSITIPLTKICRNNCGYCSFREDPGLIEKQILHPDEVGRILENGYAAGCREALFLLGENPEEAAPEILNLLKTWGFVDFTDYMWHMCETALENKLLPHLNSGLLAAKDIERLRTVNVSMGLMLESTSTRLCEKNGPHELSPGKNPSLRLNHIAEAGKLKVPFTTGILVGIGESFEERLDALFRLKDLHVEYGHIQELIIQNFSPKPGTLMEDYPEPSVDELLKTITAARLIFGEEMNIQAPPNLMSNFTEALYAGINDWGGISPVGADVINPEKPWPEIEELRGIMLKEGYAFRERLPVYPKFITDEFIHLNTKFREYLFSLIDEEGYIKEK